MPDQRINRPELRYQDSLSQSELERDETLFEDCVNCNDVLNDNTTEVVNDNGEHLCSSCYDSIHTTCNCCDVEMLRSDANHTEDGDVCSDCRSEDYFDCNICGDVSHSDHCVYSSDRDIDMCENCYEDDEYVESEDRRSDEVNWNVFNNSYVIDNTDFVTPINSGYNMSESLDLSFNPKILKNTFDVTYTNREGFENSFNLIKSRRYQGVEIEFNSYDSYDRGEIYNSLHGAMLATRSNRFKRSDWSDYMERSLQVVYDGSVIGENHPHGAEIVMSPRRGDVLYEDLKTVNQSLKSHFDAYISHKCGYHLHIDVRDYDWYHFAVLLAMTKLIEPHIFCWMPASRRTSRWCHPVSQQWGDFSFINDRMSLVDTYYDGDSYRNEKYHDKRYSGMNLHSHFQGNQGLELRYHSGTLNPDKMLHWSIVWSQIVDKCYDIGSELQEKYDDGSGGSWFRNTPFIKSLQNVVSEETKVKILTAYETSTSTQFSESIESNNMLLKVSEIVRRELKIPIQDLNLEYDFHRLSSLVGVSTGHGAMNNPTMSMDNMFSIFEIPTKTRLFYGDWLERRQRSNYYSDPNHVEKCYSKTTRFVEYNKNFNDFENVGFIEHRIPTINDLESIHQDVRYRLRPELIEDYINL